MPNDMNENARSGGHDMHQHREDTRMFSRIRSPVFSGALISILFVFGCSFDVTNPGPVQDEFLDDPQAFDAIVNGVARAYSVALAGDDDGGIVKWISTVTREIFPSGNQVSFGVGPFAEQGLIEPEVVELPWNGAQNARWMAETAIERLEGVLGGDAGSDPLVAEVYMWAGFANRLLGENMCQAVFDGEDAQPPEAFLTSAEDQFTTAIGIAEAAGADEIATASVAGRASVRMDLGDWDGAVADAGAVPVNFAFQAQYFNIDEPDYNIWAWSKMGAPYRSFSVWNTPYEAYGTTGDPRVGWDLDPESEFGNLARPCCGQVPFMRQTKYNAVDDPIDLADGREMLLIQAEALLRDGDWPAAMQIVNDDLRGPLGVAPWTVSDLAEAWTAFRFERGIELWLEGRRLNDHRRWEAESAAGMERGSHQPLEDPANPDTFLDPNRSLCFPIPQSETNTNPNVG